MVDLSVKIGSVTLANPVMPASGTFSAEFSKVIDLNRLGALVTKTVSRVAPAARSESSRARTLTVWGFENRFPVRACSRAVPTAVASETPVALSSTVRVVSSELQ